MATILLLIHFISLWLTLMSLLQPCDDNCIKKNCDSTNSHALERFQTVLFHPNSKGWVVLCQYHVIHVIILKSIKDPFSYQRVQCYQYRRYPYLKLFCFIFISVTWIFQQFILKNSYLKISVTQLPFVQQTIYSNTAKSISSNCVIKSILL